jgi:5-methylthioadenosine/S-adenosylhomocysteine deaminase
VYAARGSDVHTALVDGEMLVTEGRLVREDASAIAAEAHRQAARLATRAGIV